MADTIQSDTGAPAPDPGRGGRRPGTMSLSSKLLWLTILFVMIAEVLIFVPSVANTRVRWLADRLNTAAAAAVVIEGVDEMELPQSIQDDTLMATGTTDEVRAYCDNLVELFADAPGYILSHGCYFENTTDDKMRAFLNAVKK